MSLFAKIVDKRALLSLGALCLFLTACDSFFAPTPTPDYTIRVVPGPSGMTAVAPECLDWAHATASPFDNQPIPHFGCADARNLAFMVERPEDLIHGRDMGDSSGVLAVGAMRRYYGSQTRGLLDTASSPDSSLATTTATTATSSMTGDATGAAGGSSAASSTGSAAPAGP